MHLIDTWMLSIEIFGIGLVLDLGVIYSFQGLYAMLLFQLAQFIHIHLSTIICHKLKLLLTGHLCVIFFFKLFITIIVTRCVVIGVIGLITSVYFCGSTVKRISFILLVLIVEVDSISVFVITREFLTLSLLNLWWLLGYNSRFSNIA